MSRVEQWELEEAKEEMVEAANRYQELLERSVAQEIEDAPLHEAPFGVELTWPKSYWRSLENQWERDERADDLGHDAWVWRVLNSPRATFSFYPHVFLGPREGWTVQAMGGKA